MAIRDQMRANAAPFLQPGEEIQAVMSAQTMNQYLSILSQIMVIISGGYRVIVVTDRRILVCRTGRFRLTPVEEVLREVPRNTVIGPAHGLWYRTNALGQKLYISIRFQKDVATADAAIQGGVS